MPSNNTRSFLAPRSAGARTRLLAILVTVTGLAGILPASHANTLQYDFVPATWFPASPPTGSIVIDTSNPNVVLSGSVDLDGPDPLNPLPLAGFAVTTTPNGIFLSGETNPDANAADFVASQNPSFSGPTDLQDLWEGVSSGYGDGANTDGQWQLVSAIAPTGTVPDGGQTGTLLAIPMVALGFVTLRRKLRQRQP